MRARVLLGAVVTAAGLAILSAQAGAVIVPSPTGRVSLAPRQTEGPSARARTAEQNLIYHEPGDRRESVLLQQEWGNGAGACEQRNALPAAVFAPPPATSTGATLTFSADGSADSDGGISSYAWDFGDGAVSAQV